MRGPRNASVAYKKINPEMFKRTKARSKMTMEKASKKKGGALKDSAAPKRPVGAFFIFMEEFRKGFKENFPDNKLRSAVGKAGGEKWKSMSDAEKAPYVEKAMKRKAEYEKALEVYKNANVDGNYDKPEDSEKSISEVQDEAEQEASS